MAGLNVSALTGDALPLAIKAIRKLSDPVTQEKLLAAIENDPQVPKLTRRQRRRLKKVIGSDAAANALIDQGAAGVQALSTAIAHRVLKEQASERSRAIAEALITDYPRCVPGAENTVLVACQLRDIGQELRSQRGQLAGISQPVSAVHAIVAMAGPVPIDPEVILNGPLDGLRLQANYQKVLEWQGTDPARAAQRLAEIIETIDQAGHIRLARRFREQRADLLARGGQFVQAADAWLPMVDDYLTVGHGYGTHDAVNSWEALAAQAGAPAWLHFRRAAVIALEEQCILGDHSAGDAMNLAVRAADAGDPAAPLWLMYAAEACLTDNQPGDIEQHRVHLLAAAAETMDPMVAVRLKLAVADASGDGPLWEQLVSDTVPGPSGVTPELAALILARRARKLFWEHQIDQSVTLYRAAAARGSHTRLWQDAASWLNSARLALCQSETVNGTDLAALGQQQTALEEAGPGSLLAQGYDWRTAAEMKLMEIDATDGPARSARIDLRRYLGRSIILGDLGNELDAHQLLGRLNRQMAQAEPAAPQYITARNAAAASEVA
jgi:hypothetical protein